MVTPRYDTNLAGYVVEIDESRLKGAPSYPVGTEPAWAIPTMKASLHDYYGVGPYWTVPSPL